jgi:cytochrome d ubiquinol oxidase subunit II
MDPAWLVYFSAGIIAFSILMYVIPDGYDLGVGILFGTMTDERDRVRMMAIAAFWDGNETWLVLTGAGLFAAFPIVFRGVAFEFRYRSIRMRPVWDRGFFLGSLIAARVQGAAIGAMVQELPVVGGRYFGGGFDWLTPFAILCSVGAVLGYAPLGGAWLMRFELAMLAFVNGKARCPLTSRGG